MAKEEPKKDKKSKSKAAAAAKGATAATPGARAAVIASVAAFLESAGLPRTLAALQSEAGLEAGEWWSSQVILEELVAKFLESSNLTPADAVLGSSEQDKENGDIAGEVGKKKKKNGTEAGEPESKASEPSTQEKPRENMGGDAKEKKQKKDRGDPREEAEVKVDPSVANAASSAATETMKNDDQKLDVDGDSKEKKHKKKKDKGDLSAADAASGEATGTVKNNDQKLDMDSEAKEKKQKKDKVEAAEKVNGDGNESREEEPKSQNDGADDRSGPVEKKNKSVVETSEKTDAGSALAQADGDMGNNGAVEAVKDENLKKAKKKWKKSNLEENVQVEGKKAAGKDSVPKPDDANKSGMDVDEDHQGKSSNENAVAGKKQKLEVEGSIAPVTLKEDSTANQSLSNGFDEDKTKEERNIKPCQRQEKSSEGKPKRWRTFQHGYPTYLEQMDRMYEDEVDGSSSFVAPGSPPRTPNTPIRVDSSDEGDEDDEDLDDQATSLCSDTPRSNPSKRSSSTSHSNPSKKASSTSTTARSPSKRSQSSAVSHTMQSMSRHNELLSQKNEIQSTRNDLIHDLVRKEAKVLQAYDIVEELGVSSDMDPVLYHGFLRILEPDTKLTAFIRAKSSDSRFMMADASRVVN